MTVVVHGVPVGAHATLSVSVDRGNLHALLAPGCSPSGKGFTCQADDVAHSTFSFVVANSARPRVTYSVDVPAGWTDPSPGNNSGSVQATGRGGHGPGHH